MRWQGYGAIDNGTRCFNRFYNLLGGFINQIVIIRFQLNSNPLVHGYWGFVIRATLFNYITFNFQNYLLLYVGRAGGIVGEFKAGCCTS